jgi:hypothetical protein
VSCIDRWYRSNTREISFKESVTRVHFDARTKEPLKPQLTRLCGATLRGVAAAKQYFEVVDGDQDGELHMVEIVFKGKALTATIKETLAERQKQRESNESSGAAAKARTSIEPTPEEALYYGFRVVEASTDAPGAALLVAAPAATE